MIVFVIIIWLPLFDMLIVLGCYEICVSSSKGAMVPSYRLKHTEDGYRLKDTEDRYRLKDIEGVDRTHACLAVCL